MWLKQLIVAVAFSSSLLPISVLAQAVTNQRPLAATMILPGQTNLLMLYPQFGQSHRFATNWNAGLATPALSLNRASPAAPRPGIYKTEPYAFIVLVPATQPDDRSVVKPAERGSAMPVIKPELRFIPRPAK